MAAGLLKRRPLSFTALLILLGLVVLAVLAWAFRVPLSELAIGRWCVSNGYECEAEVRSVGLDGAETGPLLIRAEDGSVPFETDAARIELDWAGFLQPVVTFLSLEEPVLRGRYRPDEPLEFGGLERFAGGDGSGELPSVDIRNATLALDTPAGVVTVHGTVKGDLPYQAEIDARVEPVELRSEDGEIVLREGHVDVTLTGLRLDGSARFDLAMARFEGFSARDLSLEASMADSLRPTVVWSAQAGEIDGDALSVREADLQGRFSLTPAAMDDEAGLVERLHAASLSGTTGALRWQAQLAASSTISLDIQRKAKDLLGDFALQASDVARPEMSIGSLTVTGSARTTPAFDSLSAAADIVTENAALSPDLREAYLPPAGGELPFSSHMRALHDMLDTALADVDVATSVAFDHNGEGGWSLTTTRPVTLKAANGVTMSAKPLEARPVLNLADDGTRLAGLFDLTGPDGFRLSADIEEARFGEAAPAFKAGGVSLAQWRADGLTLAADLNELSFSHPNGGSRLALIGNLRIDGTLYGLDFDDTRIFGGFEAAGSDSLRIQTYQTDCFGLETGGISSGGDWRLRPVTLQLCPTEGRVARRSGSGYAGTVRLRDAALPFESASASGELDLNRAVIQWSAAETVSLDVSAQSLLLPLAIGEKTLSISAAKPEIGFETSEPARLTATLGTTEFGGSLLPADISLESADLSARLAPGGLDGKASATRVAVRDRGADPLYEPLYGDLAATFEDGVMRLTGPFTTARAGRTIAHAQMTLDLVALDGEAHLVSEALTFAPDRLQPTALSERVRGLLSNARGTLEAEAHFGIDGGSPSGHGRVRVEDFGFDTLRLGAVEGVTGEIRFDDILSLSTPPGQEIRIGAIHPGIPLRDGSITFQLTDARLLHIEQARWPFAGGALVIDESDWTISGAADIVRIHARSLELTEIVEIFSLPDLEANGTVSGTFPVEFEGANAYVRDARLFADEEGGAIAYTGAIADRASQADERVSMAFRALRDFRFSVLELGADGNLTGDMRITVKLVGKSPKVLDGTPFAFNIAVDSKLMQLIRTGRSITTSDWLADVTADAVAERQASEEPPPPE